MPIYEYQCQECGYQFDKLQKISDDPLTDCPSCNAASLKKLVSAPSFRLSGSGWYETDFKSDKEKRRNLAATDSSPAPAAAAKPAKTEPSKATKTESKPSAASKQTT